jgi:hypothetical protein
LWSWTKPFAYYFQLAPIDSTAAFSLYPLLGSRLRWQLWESGESVSRGNDCNAVLAIRPAAQVWNDNERANAAVNREASALRAVVVLAANLPEEPKQHLRDLIRRYIQEVTTQEWPMMAQGTATLKATPSSLAEALQLTLALGPAQCAAAHSGREARQRQNDDERDPIRPVLST